MELIFATNNQHKVEEMQIAVGNKLKIRTMKEAGFDIDIPEPHESLEENALEKSSTIHRLSGQNCFSEDTGLEVEALNGEPGVKSARYAGDVRDFQSNIDKLLNKLSGETNMKARFRTIISLIWKNENYYFEGICDGRIIPHQKGLKGFGYDPIFIPDGSEKTLAEMDLIEKNLFSHRRKAADQLVSFLQNQL